MKTTTDFSNNLIDYKILEIDKRYREKFKHQIIEAKKLTHNCQYLCYNSIRTDLNDAEKCAKNCFLPMIHIKKNIGSLIETSKDNFEKCKSTASNGNNKSEFEINKIDDCLNIYQEELNKTKEEAEYIYAGYMKNFTNKIKGLKNNDN